MRANRGREEKIREETDLGWSGPNVTSQYWLAGHGLPLAGSLLQYAAGRLVEFGFPFTTHRLLERQERQFQGEQTAQKKEGQRTSEYQYVTEQATDTSVNGGVNGVNEEGLNITKQQNKSVTKYLSMDL